MRLFDCFIQLMVLACQFLRSHSICSSQGLTKLELERDQMALGVFPNCHECQKIDFQVMKKKLRLEGNKYK